MARRSTKKKAGAAPEVIPASWPVTLTGVAFLLVQVVFLPGAASAFRLPKEALAFSAVLFVVALGTSLRLRAGTLTIPRGPLVPVLLGLPVLQLASSLWAFNPRQAATTAAVTAVWVLAAFWLASLDAAARQRVAWMTAAGVTVSAVVLLMQAAGTPILVVGQSSVSRFRMSGLAGNPADFATSAVLLLPILLVTAEAARRSGRGRWAVIGLLVVAAVISQTLTGYIALALLAAVWLWRRRSLKLWLTAAVIAILAGALAFGTGLGRRVQRQVERVQSGDWYSVFSARGDGWTAAAEMTREHPVLGVGAGQYSTLFYPHRLAWLERRGETGRRGELATHFEWAHSDPLQMVAELGLAGALWMVGLVWALWRTRVRGDPVLPLAAAATVPFLMLHYPTHLAIGLIPIAIVLGHQLASGPQRPLPKAGGVIRMVVPVVLITVALAGSVWQARRLAVNIWTAELERGLGFAVAATEPMRRTQLATAVEWQILERIDRLPAAAPTLWRIVGKARIARSDPRAAEEAFRTAHALWPHEEAELGLGLALAEQGRRSEALLLLGRVCRTNPALAAEITDPDLRRSLEDLNRARRRQSSTGGR
jgi:O-antigen ligase